MRRSVLRACAVAVIGLLAAAVIAVAQEQPSGTVTIESKSIAAGIGVSWGEGQLSYEGKTYAFSIAGLSVVDVGISKVTAKGDVFNLKKVEDFAGNYAAVEAGAAVGGGVAIVRMRNQNGVVMHLTSTQQGVQFTLAPKGIEVKLK